MSAARHPIRFLGEALAFPPPEASGPEGLLAAGGDLSPERLLLAYRSGIFPWFNDDSLILWWSPDPRMVLFPKQVKVSRSMAKIIQRGDFSITKNKRFPEVIRACAHIRRKGESGTWITEQMIAAYTELHRLGYAVSYEAWQGDQLAGGLYGVELGGIFCGESMFSKVSNASKAAFIQMVREQEARGCRLIDCQMYTPHLASLGAVPVARTEFLSMIRAAF